MYTEHMWILMSVQRLYHVPSKNLVDIPAQATSPTTVRDNPHLIMDTMQPSDLEFTPVAFCKGGHLCRFALPVWMAQAIATPTSKAVASVTSANEF